MSIDEQRILALLRTLCSKGVEENEERIHKAAAQYGDLDLETDGRNFVAETIEELIDARFYLAAAAIKPFSESEYRSVLEALSSVNDAIERLWEER